MTVLFQQVAKPFDLLLHRFEHPGGMGSGLGFRACFFILVKLSQPEMSLRLGGKAPEFLLTIPGFLILLDLVQRRNIALLSLTNLLPLPFAQQQNLTPDAIGPYKVGDSVFLR